jgi:hypothetical protein
MAFFCAEVILGGKNPWLVELASSTAEEVLAVLDPTITFPLAVIGPEDKEERVPTVVKLEVSTFEARVLPVNVPALAAPGAAETHVVPFELSTLPLVPGATARIPLVPFPNNTLLAAKVV